MTKLANIPTGSDIAIWQAKLRAVVFDAVKESDIKEMMQALVGAAKRGDPAACKLVFDYVLGGTKGTFTQNNVRVELAPTSARQGTRDKVAIMAKRAANGQPLHHDKDGDDEE